jgi:phosphoglycerol transferase MdoB-like AlkP superfamily enzyme
VSNYNQNGFIIGFLYNIKKLDISPPDNYSDAKIREIRATYTKLANSLGEEKLHAADEDINFIVVLNESFFDPMVSFQGYNFRDFYPQTGGEILPNLRKIQAKYPSGYMYSLDYGGGTANIEFEALTGFTNYWINAVPYTHLIPAAGEIPSIASYLKSAGYKTTAIHPFNGSMYKRNIVFKNFGFDTFITEPEMDYTEKEGGIGYINDRSAYRQVLDVLNSSKKNQLITLVTMQNHLPYSSEIHSNPQFGTTAIDIEEQRRSDIAVYYQMLHNSDAYLGELIAALNQSEKKVVMLFFGDHAPGLFDLTNNNPVKEVRDLSRLTPYFIYTNFNGTPGVKKLPTTTPNCLMNTMFGRLGFQKPVHYYLLDEICAQTPILTPAWHEETIPLTSKELDAYELVTYDILGGKRYWFNP